MGLLWGRGTDPALMAMGGDWGAVGPGLNARGGGETEVSGGVARRRQQRWRGWALRGGSSERPDPIGGPG